MNAAVQPLQPMQNWVWGPVSLDALHAYVLTELLSLNWLFVSCVLNGLLDTNPIAWQMNKKNVTLLSAKFIQIERSAISWTSEESKIQQILLGETIFFVLVVPFYAVVIENCPASPNGGWIRGYVLVKNELFSVDTWILRSSAISSWFPDCLLIQRLKLIYLLDRPMDFSLFFASFNKIIYRTITLDKNGSADKTVIIMGFFASQ